MASAVTVQISRRQIDRVQRLVGAIPRGMPRVMSRAINKTATKARTKIVRTVAGEIAIKHGELKRRNVKLRKASYRRWIALIQISGGRIPVIHFGARETPRGVSYRIKKAGGRKSIPHAFIATMPSGHEGVFLRRGAPRLPLGPERRGPSVPAVVENVQSLSAGILDSEIASNLGTEVARQVGVLLDRGR